ncbi:MAG: PBP1A family penicillin-binding protein [Deltaproteobacteria bacterium]|nr:PBP1A family penicillin-binding protein [Deltaproteobacteria bacterium]
MPYIGSLEEYSPPVITEIYSENGETIGRFWTEKRAVVPLEQISDYMKKAILSAEDARFYEHEGVDFQGIFRAFTKNLAAGKIEQGGSTITQQVTKSLLLKNTTKTYKRKAREAILSLQIEKTFSKDKILFLYLNQIYLGHSAYGVEMAAQTYFGKKAAELNLAESAMIAGLPQAPSRYSPISHFEAAKKRQKYVLARMREDGHITSTEEKEAFEKEIVLKEKEENYFARTPYFTEHIRKYLEEQYGKDLLYSGGLKVYTTLDLDMQMIAQAAVIKGLDDLDKREGYRGPLRSLVDPAEMETFREECRKKLAKTPLEISSVVEALVEEVDDEKREVIVSIGDEQGVLSVSAMKWAREPDPKVPYFDVTVEVPSEVLSTGDVILCRVKDKIAIIADQEENEPIGKELDGQTEIKSGLGLALASQRDENQYIYQLFLEQEVLPQGALLSIEPSTGKVKAMVGGRSFYESQFNRAIQARRQPGSAFKPIIYAAALEKGMTPATVILDSPYVSSTSPEPDEEIWKPHNYAEKFFGPTLLRTALILSRNVITVKILKEIRIPYVINYARRMGIKSELAPDLSLSLGSSGLSLEEITAAYAIFANGGMLVKPYFINKIEDRSGQVIEEGQPVIQEAISGAVAYVMTDLLKATVTEGTGWRAKALNRPAAGKTGTTNDLKDAWFMGYTPELVTGVWVGYDNRISMGHSETGSRAACPIWLQFMKDALADMPVQDFPVPEDVVFARIDAEKGLLASQYSKKTVFQSFVKNTEPDKYTPKPEAARPGEFQQFDMEHMEF